jgi:hypothetical protein
MSDIIVPGSKDLVFINAIANEYEETAGPLTSMGNRGGDTTMSFDDAAPSPTSPVVIAPDASGVPATPAGLKAFLRGVIVISGTPTPSTAYRA